MIPEDFSNISYFFMTLCCFDKSPNMRDGKRSTLLYNKKNSKLSLLSSPSKMTLFLLSSPSKRQASLQKRHAPLQTSQTGVLDQHSRVTTSKNKQKRYSLNTRPCLNLFFFFKQHTHLEQSLRTQNEHISLPNNVLHLHRPHQIHVKQFKNTCFRNLLQHFM